MAVSTGTLVAASMETMGYIVQANVIADLTPMLTNLAMLLFIGSMIFGIVTIAMNGKYDQFLWFLVGPALFYFVVCFTQSAAGPKWQLGAFQGKDYEIRNILGSSEPIRPVNVSVVFHWYNNIISSIVQETVKVITSNDIRAQVKFMSRQKIMDRMFGFRLDDPGLMSLTKLALQGECGKEMEGARQIALGNRDQWLQRADRLGLATIESGDKVRGKKISIPTGTLAYRYLLELFESINNSDAKDLTWAWCRHGERAVPDPPTATSASEIELKGISCQQIFCWTGLAFAQKARSVQSEAANKDIETEYATPEIYKEIWESIAVKMAEPDEVNAVSPDLSVIPVIVAGAMLRKQLTTDTRSQMLTSFAENAGITVKPYNMDRNLGMAEKQDKARREGQHRHAEALRWEIFHYAMTLPYLQGCMLFMAAVTFPFFGVLLVIPGKADGFLTWMALWAWLKSWDVGWALVMVIDDAVLWPLMPHTSEVNPRLDPNHGPITILQAAFEADPAFSLSTYYMILGTMIAAVPLVTAQVVMGAKGAVMGTMATGMRAMSQSIGGAAHDFFAASQTMTHNEMRKDFYLNYLKKHAKPGTKDFKWASTRLEAMSNDVESLRSKGKALAAAGKSEGGSASTIVPAAAALASPGGGAKLIAGAMAGGKIGQAEAKWEAGISMQREANMMEAQLLEMNAYGLMEEADRTDKGIQLLGSAQASSNRGEWWRTIQVQQQIPLGLAKMKTDIVASREGWNEFIKGHTLGSTIQGILPSNDENE